MKLEKAREIVNKTSSATQFVALRDIPFSHHGGKVREDLRVAVRGGGVHAEAHRLLLIGTLVDRDFFDASCQPFFT